VSHVARLKALVTGTAREGGIGPAIVTRLLVRGAAAGVGTAAIQGINAFGCRSIAIVSSDEKERAVRALGADDIVRSTEGWLEQVRALRWARVEIAIGTVDGTGFSIPSGRCRLAAPRRRRVRRRSIPTLKVNRLLLRNLTITAITMDVYEETHPGTVAMVNAAVQCWPSRVRSGR
jgi:NADPH:quinone reductase